MGGRWGWVMGSWGEEAMGGVFGVVVVGLGR